MDVFLAFTNRQLEQRWWRQYRQGRFKTLAVRTSCGCLIVSTTLFITSVCRGIIGWQLLLFYIIQCLEFGTTCAMWFFFKETWEEVREGVFMFFRVVLSPMSHNLLRGSLYTLLGGHNVFGLVTALIVGFGGLAPLADSFTFPLKFRQHLITQLFVTLEWGVYNWKYCENSCLTESERETVVKLCSALAMMSTGILVDCGRGGFHRACLSAGLQIPTLFGLVGASFFIYKLEQASRLAFLRQQGNHDDGGPSTGTG